MDAFKKTGIVGLAGQNPAQIGKMVYSTTTHPECGGNIEQIENGTCVYKHWSWKQQKRGTGQKGRGESPWNCRFRSQIRARDFRITCTPSPPRVVVRSPCQRNYPADAHTGAHKSVLESTNPALTRSVHLDAPGQRHRRQPSSGTADPGVPQQGKSSRGSVDTTKISWDQNLTEMCQCLRCRRRKFSVGSPLVIEGFMGAP